MPPAKLQPALFGGLFIGVLSALPIINLGNCLCCMWVIGGGALDGLLVIPLALAFGPTEHRIIQRALESSQDVPPEVRSMFDHLATGGVLGVMAIVGVFIRAIVFGVIAMLGGLLGLALFKKKDLPPGTTAVMPPS